LVVAATVDRQDPAAMNRGSIINLRRQSNWGESRSPIATYLLAGVPGMGLMLISASHETPCRLFCSPLGDANDFAGAHAVWRGEFDEGIGHVRGFPQM
jgi:hypothetical protein